MGGSLNHRIFNSLRDCHSSLYLDGVRPTTVRFPRLHCQAILALNYHSDQSIGCWSSAEDEEEEEEEEEEDSEVNSSTSDNNDDERNDLTMVDVSIIIMTPGVHNPG